MPYFLYLKDMKIDINNIEENSFYSNNKTLISLTENSDKDNNSSVSKSDDKISQSEDSFNTNNASSNQ